MLTRMAEYARSLWARVTWGQYCERRLADSSGGVCYAATGDIRSAFTGPGQNQLIACGQAPAHVAGEKAATADERHLYCCVCREPDCDIQEPHPRGEGQRGECTE